MSESFGWSSFERGKVFASLRYNDSHVALTLTGTVFLDCTDAGIDALAQWMKDYVAERRAAQQKDTAKA